MRELSWDDIAIPVRQLLTSHGFNRENFRERTAELRRQNRIRVREGDRDHLVFYALQSTAFTRLPPIEPALSAREFLATGRIPAQANARLDEFATAARSPRDYGARMAIFRELLERESINLADEYRRAMRFAAAPVGTAYQARGLSTDTSIEAGYAVYLLLAALRRLEPERQIRSVLIVGPGMDLAPRTGFVESGEPQSHQPFAVADALLATGLAARENLRVSAADINPRVVEWIVRARGTRPTLALVSSVQERGQVQLTEDYREYFSTVGRAIGVEKPPRQSTSWTPTKSIALASGVTDLADAALADITVERLDARFDLVVVTNVFPYLSDAELLLAVSNIAAMLNPGGILIHNEPRPVLADALLALRLPLLQSRSGIIATVQGASPVYDAAWMHAAAP